MIKSIIYFFDFIELFQIVLLSIEFRVKIYTKMIFFVDQSFEFYYFLIWILFIKSYFGEYVFYFNQISIFFWCRLLLL